MPAGIGPRIASITFTQFKAILLSDLLLTRYDPSKEIIVAADAPSWRCHYASVPNR